VDAAAGAVRRSGAIFVNDAVNRFVFAKAPQTNTDTGAIMGGFYKRIVIMHLAIMGGAFIAQAIGTAAPLIVLVLLKIAIEIRFQMKARKGSVSRLRGEVPLTQQQRPSPGAGMPFAASQNKTAHFSRSRRLL
jgi:hypothetical protein